MSRRPTLAEERSMLAELRERSTLVAWDELHDVIAAREGVAYVDQLKAASAEATRQLKAVAGKEPFTACRESGGSVEFAAMLVAAVFRCMAGSYCEHAIAGDRPLLAFPAARVIACHRCILRYRGALAAQDQRVRENSDRLCDFCLEERDWFHPYGIAYGPAQVFGDMCGDCHAGQAEAAAS